MNKHFLARSVTAAAAFSLAGSVTAGPAGSVTFGPVASAVPALGGVALALLAGLLALAAVAMARQRQPALIVAALACGALVVGGGGAQLARDALAKPPSISDPEGGTIDLFPGETPILNESGIPLQVLDVTTVGACTTGTPDTGPECVQGLVVDDQATCSVDIICPSDRRLKTDIQRIGTTVHELPLYRYRYIGHAAVYEGVMAQDVLAVAPQAVVVSANGYYAVDYGLLGAPFRRVR